MPRKKRMIKDSQELKKYINLDLKEVQKEYGESLLVILKQKEYEDVYKKRAINYFRDYEDDTPQEDEGYWLYDRTYDLYDLFQITFKGSNRYKTIMSIIPMDNKLSHSWEDYQHASPIGNDLSATKYLNIIEYGLPSRKSMFGETNPRPFWKDFLEYVNIESPHAKNLYETILNKHIKGAYPMTHLDKAAEIS